MVNKRRILRSLVFRVALILGPALVLLLCGYIFFIKRDQTLPVAADMNDLQILIESALRVADASADDRAISEAFEAGVSRQGLVLKYTDTPSVTASSELTAPVEKLLTRLTQDGYTAYAIESTISPEDFSVPSSPPIEFMALPGVDSEIVSLGSIVDTGPVQGLDLSNFVFLTHHIGLSVQHSATGWINIDYQIFNPDGSSGQLPVLAAGIFIPFIITLIIIQIIVSSPLGEIAKKLPVSFRNNVLLPESGAGEVTAFLAAINRVILANANSRERYRVVLTAISHDLHTPISSLRIRSEFIRDEKLQTDIQGTLLKMESMTSSILEAARGGEVDEPISSVEISSLIEVACEEFSGDVDRITLELLDYTIVEGKKTELMRLVQNLVSNALKFGDGIVAVSMHREAGNLVIDVDDNGPGIPENMMDKVTEPLFRLEGSRNPETGGHGLGLTIVESIAQRHGGELRLRNLEPTGLRASFILPLSGKNM